MDLIEERIVAYAESIVFSPTGEAHREPVYWQSRGADGYAVAHNSLGLSRDFQVSGSLLRCITATISKLSFLIWQITPYGNLLVRQRWVRFDSLNQASGYWTIRSSVLFTSAANS